MELFGRQVLRSLLEKENEIWETRACMWFFKPWDMIKNEGREKSEQHLEGRTWGNSNIRKASPRNKSIESAEVRRRRREWWKEGDLSKEEVLWHIVTPLPQKSASDIYNKRACSLPQCISRVLGRCMQVTHDPGSPRQ